MNLSVSPTALRLTETVPLQNLYAFDVGDTKQRLVIINVIIIIECINLCFTTNIENEWKLSQHTHLSLLWVIINTAFY
jgi:hypothetical protein